MIKFSQNAEVVVLLRDVDAVLFTAPLMAAALAAFHQRPALALLVCVPLNPTTPQRRPHMSFTRVQACDIATRYP
jgi:hypothetical protein